MTVGERAFTRYIKHPTSGLGGDTAPLSAWIGQVLCVSNANHLAQVACRQLGSLVLPDAMVSIPETADSDAAWTRVNSPRPSPVTTYNAIPWDRATSIKLGPFPLILDTQYEGTPNARKIVCRFSLQVDAAATTRNLYAAITQSADGRSPASGSAIVAGSTTCSTGDVNAAITLTPQLTRGRFSYDSEDWHCRTGISTSDGKVTVLPAYVWFGWLIDGGLSRVKALTAYEVR